MPELPTTAASSLVARASKTVRNKNIILILLFGTFAGMFLYDGLVRWPARNDRIVVHMHDHLLVEKKLDEKYRKALEGWPKWKNANEDQKKEMGAIAKLAGDRVEEWKGDLDLGNQLYIAYALIAGTLGAIFWFVHCQRRRVMADERGLSPSPGVMIAWDQIAVVDNTDWNKKGYVYITYTEGTTPTAVKHEAKLDDYIVDRQPLIEILKLIEARATHAEFLPKATASPES